MVPGTGATLVEHRTIGYESASGTIDIVVSGDDERVDETIGQAATAYGSFRGRDWSMNANGEVVVEQGIHRADEVNRAALRDAASPRGSRFVRLLGRILSPIHAYVVQVNPPRGVLEYLYIDSDTWLYDATVLRYPGYSERYAYDDYRTTAGQKRPWHIHISRQDAQRAEELAGREIDERDTSVLVGTSVDPNRIAIPPSRCIVSVDQPKAPLPGKIVQDRVILPVQLGSRSVNLQLDSGAGGILVDDGVVRALGYPITLGDAVIPSMRIGPLSMQGVHVSAKPFGNMVDSQTPVAGLIGFDFIDCVVMHVDYEDGTTEVLDPTTFAPPPGAVAIPIALDDRVPAIAASVGPATSTRFLVDTGADTSALFSSFPKNHPGGILQGGVGAEMAASSPFLSQFFAVGGTVKYREVEAGPLRVGAWNFPSWPFNLTLDAATFDFQDYDGILGQDFLRYYDLYLDYPHGRILLVPNARYAQRFG